MKAVLIIALLALTAIAMPSGISELHKGFSAKLGLTAEQDKEAEACANSLQVFALKYSPVMMNPKFATGVSLYEFIEESDAKKTAFLKQVEEDAMTILMPTCGAYVGNIIIHLQKGIKSQEAALPFQIRAMINANRYPAELISKVVQVYDQVKEQKNHAAGETLGHILQVLSGNVAPTQVQVPRLRGGIATPDAAMVYEFVNSFLEHVGIKHKVTLKEIEALFADVHEFNKQMEQLKKEINHPKGLIEEIVSLTKIPQVVINTYTKVHDQLKKWFPETQVHYDVHTMLAAVHTMLAAVPRVIHNVALNLPVVEGESAKFVDALGAKKAADAGKHLAEIVKIAHH